MPNSAPEGSRQALRALEKKMGKVLNIHGEMAHSPVVIATYIAMQQAIADHGTFDARTREAVALAVGAVDGCDYCQSAHTVSGTAAGLTGEQAIAIRRGANSGGEALDALLSVARETAGGLGNVTEEMWQAALTAGWSEEQLTELFAHVAVNLYTNYFNHVARTDLDLPAAPGIS